ncbi:MAG: hypothetical protein AB7O59_09820 [Pirellulales bacterium]
MEHPEARQLAADLEAPPYLLGEGRGRWGRTSQPTSEWPIVFFWVQAGEREKGPDRFGLRLDCAGYATRSPTGGFWDLDKNEMLPEAKWPKGTNRVEDVFKFGWRGGTALYHPFDRVTWDAHPNWPQQYASLAWTRDHTIADYLRMVHELLNCSEYRGVY